MTSSGATDRSHLSSETPAINGAYSGATGSYSCAGNVTGHTSLNNLKWACLYIAYVQETLAAVIVQEEPCITLAA